MIDPLEALGAFNHAGVHFFTGVPDSLLKEFNACVAENVDLARHVVAHNEGGAVAMAAGNYLATGEPGLVYLQNSGLGNAVNPLVSLTSPEVYGIPMVLMIGWRGQPGKKDEPQHRHQGRVSEEMLSLLDVPVFHLDEGTKEWAAIIEESVASAKLTGRPTALIVSAGTFAPYQRGPIESGVVERRPRRIDAVSTVLDTLSRETIYFATTGYAARELAALRLKRGEPDDHDFLVVGSMGHAASLALGTAMARPEVQVVCLDGDGSLAMHLGVMAVVGERAPHNLGHVLLNNGVHESVGGQPSAFASVNAPQVAMACGYRSAGTCEDLEELRSLLQSHTALGGPWFVEVGLVQGTIDDLPRADDFGQRMSRLRSVLGS